MNPSPSWPPEGAVRVDTLRPDDRFRCMQGQLWTFKRRDGALSGVYHVVGDNGERNCFAGCAEVVKIST